MHSLLCRAIDTGVSQVVVGANQTVLIRTVTIRFGNASPPYLKYGTLPESYTDKPLVSVNGDGMFGELAIARLLEQAGWESVWVDTEHNRRFWRAMPNKSDPVVLPLHVQTRYDAIVAASHGKASGFFDVIAWRGEELAFIEYREAGSEAKSHELEWIVAALKAGVGAEEMWYVIQS